jgi:hypothetical protein
MSTHDKLLAALDEMNEDGKRMTAECAAITTDLHERTMEALVIFNATVDYYMKQQPLEPDEGQDAFTEGHRNYDA